MAIVRGARAIAAMLFCGVCPFLPAADDPGAAGNPPYIVRHWGVGEGLPQSSVIAITQTHDGYLWLGTLGGLARFDGVRFDVSDEANTPGLNSSRIVCLFEDRRRNLWVGTEAAGVVRVVGGQARGFDPLPAGRESRLRSACEDTNGTVWLYTADGQLCRYRDGRAEVRRLAPNSDCRVVFADGDLVFAGSDTNLIAWRATDDLNARDLPAWTNKLDFAFASRSGGHWRFVDGRIEKWNGLQRTRDFGVYPWTTNIVVTTACEDNQGNLVVGTGNLVVGTPAGVFWFDAQGKVSHLTTADGLSGNYVLSLQAGQEGDLWVGTDGDGLNRVKRSAFEVVRETLPLVVQSVSEDRQGGLWIGANNGGVSYWREGRWQQGFAMGTGPVVALNPIFPVRAVFVDREQRVWAGAWYDPWSGLYQLSGDSYFQRSADPAVPQQAVFALHQDRSGRLWVGTRAGLASLTGRDWQLLTTRQGLSSDVVRALADDAVGNLWIGTEGGGLNLLRDGKVSTFRKRDGGLPSDDISSLLVDDQGVLWIGTFGSGLARFHEGKWTRYSTREGLASNGVGYLIEDGLGFLWIGSNAGLMRVPKQSLNDVALGRTNVISCRTYGVADGLPTAECTQGSQPAACRARDGKLWFPTIKGLVSVDPAKLTANPLPPPVLIESVSVQGLVRGSNALQSVIPRTLVIPPGQEGLEIHFTSLNLGARDRALFRYRMEGHESAWPEPSATRVARYSRMPPGDYRFVVTACNEDGVWNETGASMAIQVLPPFWQTGWFLTATSAGLLALIVFAVHYLSTQRLARQVERMRQQAALETERKRIARDLHDQLGASLTQVSLLGEMVESDKDQPAEVEAHGRQITQTARETTGVLDEIVWAVNPSNDTLEGLVNYICKYAQDYFAVAGVSYRLDVPAQLPDAEIPPEVRHNVFLASKEAVTNVVRHAKASSATIRLRLEPPGFTLEIEDNGRGFSSADEQKGRNGLRNLRKRMEDIGGVFAIGPGAQGGARVRLTVPLGKP